MSDKGTETTQPEFSPEVNEVLNMIMLTGAEQKRPAFANTAVSAEKIRDFRQLQQELEVLRGTRPVDTSQREPEFESIPQTVAGAVVDLIRARLGETPLITRPPETRAQISQAEWDRIKLELKKVQRIPFAEEPKPVAQPRPLGGGRGRLALPKALKPIVAAVMSAVK